MEPQQQNGRVSPRTDARHGALPGDAGYDEARVVWNARFDRRPAAIARCATEADVQAVLEVGRESGLPVSVRGGGHDYAGNSVCDDGLVIDVGPMNHVRINGRSKTAQVGAGATWGAFDREAQALGLATPGPTVSTVGVAGSTLGGGTGYLSRRFGLSLDNLLSGDVVTAAGDLLHASESENADLFWALRGGGGNFGIVTGLEFRLHEVGPEVLAGQIVYRIEDAGEVLRFYRELMAAAPDDVQCYPVMAGREEVVKVTLDNPEQVRQSRSDPEVLLFYRAEGARRWACAVTKRAADLGFLITVYPTDAIKEGMQIWPK